MIKGKTVPTDAVRRRTPRVPEPDVRSAVAF